MKVNYYWLFEAFTGVDQQVHVYFDGDEHLYRVFGKGENRYIRRVDSSFKQPKVTGKKRLSEMFAAIDAAAKVAKERGIQGQMLITRECTNLEKSLFYKMRAESVNYNGWLHQHELLRLRAEGASMDVMRKFYYAWHKELDEANLVEIGGTAGEFKFIVERL